MDFGRTLMHTEIFLHQLAQERISNGDLRHDPRTKVWAGKGTGALCSLCDEPIGVNEIEYEISVGGESVRFHNDCHRVWMMECAEIGAKFPND